MMKCQAAGADKPPLFYRPKSGCPFGYRVRKSTSSLSRRVIVMNVEATISELRLLPVEDRRHILRELWETLPADYPEALFSAEDLAEFRRRLQEHRDAPHTAIPWEEVRRMARERLQPCPAE